MQIKELIAELLKHNTQPNTEVYIQTSDGRTDCWRVTLDGCRLLIVPNDDLYTIEAAQEMFEERT
jgi:hypothetical protein